MRHRWSWSLAALYCAQLLLALAGLRGAWLLWPSEIAFFCAWVIPNWKDAPLAWRIKCWRARVFRPKKQYELWESVAQHNARKFGIIRLPVDGYGWRKPLPSDYPLPDIETEGEIKVCKILRTRSGYALAWVAGPPRPRGRRKLPQWRFGTARSLLGMS